jgi:hypothetical protein
VLRRLAPLRWKWQPMRMITFGTTAAQLLLQWKDSPVEDDSIHQVATATKIAEMI